MLKNQTLKILPMKLTQGNPNLYGGRSVCWHYIRWNNGRKYLTGQEPNYWISCKYSEFNKETIDDTADCDNLLTDDVVVRQETVEPTKEVEKVSDVVGVHATATFEECPDSQLYQDYVESLERFIFSKDHLKRNICKVETSYISSREFRNSTYTHTMSVRLSVLSGGLWEGPRSYVWRHLGEDVWTRGNNTKIRLVRIHVKWQTFHLVWFFTPFISWVFYMTHLLEVNYVYPYVRNKPIIWA